MNSIIIFPNDEGHLTFVYPASNCGLTIEEIAAKDVPRGKPYLIVPDELVPKDHTFFSAFEADFSQPHGEGVGAQAWFIAKFQEELATLDIEKDAAQIEFLNKQIQTQIDEAAAIGVTL